MHTPGDDLELPQALVAPPGCLPGAEPLAVAASEAVGVLILHGLTGSPAEVRGLAQACVQRGWSVAMPVLAGHSTQVTALVNTSWRDWLDSARRSLSWLSRRCATVHLVGFSMGGLLAVLLAAEQSPRKRGRVVLLAPAMALSPWQRAAVDTMATLGVIAALGKESGTDADGRPLPRYTALPFAAVAQLLRLQEHVAQRVQPLAQPVLVLHGEADLTIQAGRTAQRIRQVLGPAPQLQWVAGAGHLLLVDACAPVVTRRCLEFLEGAPSTSRS